MHTPKRVTRKDNYRTYMTEETNMRNMQIFSIRSGDGVDFETFNKTVEFICDKYKTHLIRRDKADLFQPHGVEYGEWCVILAFDLDVCIEEGHACFE